MILDRFIFQDYFDDINGKKSHGKGKALRRLIRMRKNLRVNNISPDLMKDNNTRLRKEHWYSYPHNKNITYGYKQCFEPYGKILGKSKKQAIAENMPLDGATMKVLLQITIKAKVWVCIL